MANRVTKRQVQEEFEEFGWTLNVVYEDKQNPAVRSTWVSGCNLHAAFAELAIASAHDVRAYVFTDADYEEVCNRQLIPERGRSCLKEMDLFKQAAKLFGKQNLGRIGRIR